MSQKFGSSSKKRSIYEIFRSCRLCGDSAGYRMPIIQNFVELKDTDDDLDISQIIKECAQIEVTADDKMPPLICERCLDKLNEFHAFKSLCKNINNQTRTRLGFLLQTLSSSTEEKGQTEEMMSSRGTQPAPAPQTKASNKGSRTPKKSSRTSMKDSRTLKKQSSSEIIKNSKPDKSGFGKLQPKNNYMSDSSEETTSKGVKLIEVTLEMPQGNIEDYSNTSAQASTKIPEMQVSVKVENVSETVTDSLATLRNNSKKSSKKRKIAATRRYKCNICDYIFTTSGNLKRHQILHSKEKPFQCDICDKRFARKSNLKDHILTHTKHTKERPFKCNECETSFRYSYDLKVHKTTHSGEKPFKCNICDYRGNRLGNLKDHMRTHTGEKPYKCNVCECRFITRSNLKLHKKTHTGDKPFKCNLCDYRCIQRGHLKVHVLTHTGKKPFKCSM